MQNCAQGPVIWASVVGEQSQAQVIHSSIKQITRSCVLLFSEFAAFARMLKNILLKK